MRKFILLQNCISTNYIEQVYAKGVEGKRIHPPPLPPERYLNLTHFWVVLQPVDQSLNLQCKSNCQFLYDHNTWMKWVNIFIQIYDAHLFFFTLALWFF